MNVNYNETCDWWICATVKYGKPVAYWYWMTEKEALKDYMDKLNSVPPLKYEDIK